MKQHAGRSVFALLSGAHRRTSPSSFGPSALLSRPRLVHGSVEVGRLCNAPSAQNLAFSIRPKLSKVACPTTFNRSFHRLGNPHSSLYNGCAFRPRLSSFRHPFGSSSKKLLSACTPYQAQDTGSNGGRQVTGNDASKSTNPVSAGNSEQIIAASSPQDAKTFHRPSREELLAAATGFWSRLKVRFKWSAIRSARPFNADELGAFFSWLLLGHVLWIILGTTTFVSLAIFTANTVFAQETLARWVGNYLTKSFGIKVVFESAIVPKWNDGVISFRNVFVSRRPGQGKSKVRKGSPTEEAALAAATAQQTGDENGVLAESLAAEDEDTNYTQFDLSVDTVNFTLSFRKWFNGKGPLQYVEVKGIRGVVDRTSVHALDEDIDPRTFRQEHSPGDFEIDSFVLEDLLVTVHQPGGFRPFSVSIYNCNLPQLRRQWLFYDVLSANVMSGSFDNSLFTIHPAQTHGHVGISAADMALRHKEGTQWKKQSRLRIDGLNVDHLNRGVAGPFSWIREGNVDIVADVRFPAEDEESIKRLMSDLYERVEATVSSASHVVHSKNHQEQHEDRVSVAQAAQDQVRLIILDLRVNLNDIRAAVPLFTKDLSYVNNALIRPIVAYMNSRRTFIPIHCRVIKRLNEFDGSWTIFDSGLMDDLSAEAYQAFAQDVTDDQARVRRFKKVGLWSLQLAAQALFMGLAGTFA